jgi:hypothetical protein
MSLLSVFFPKSPLLTGSATAGSKILEGGCGIGNSASAGPTPGPQLDLPGFAPLYNLPSSTTRSPLGSKVSWV